MRNYVLTGNPNTGKTTIHNLLTKSSEHVGNWHGVTVTEKHKQTKHFSVTDLPGLYSLDNTYSLEEINAVEYLKNHREDCILNIVDVNNLSRNLFLTLQLINAGYKVCLLVNMTDDLKKSGKQIDYDKLSEKLNIPVVATNGKNAKQLISQLSKITWNKSAVLKQFLSQEEIYSFIEEIINHSVQEIKQTATYGLGKLDKILLNKYLALPIFVMLIICIFYLTFSSVGAYLSDSLRNAITNFFNNSDFLQVFLKNNNLVLYNFINQCLINGVCNVLCFMPQIVILNICLNLLEESGYISRLAFLFDDFLGAVGLSGKSVFTLLMGLGCTATAITTSCNMTNKKAKNKLALLTPNISCSAKLPIYTVIGGAFFGVRNIFVILGLYLLGVIILIIQAMIYNKFNKTQETFILEFPPLRLPSIKRVLLNSVKTCISFLIKVGSVILLLSSIIWILQHFTFSFQYTQDISQSMLKHISSFILPIFMPLGFFSWGIVASLISGLVAKEMVISTISILNSVSMQDISLSLLNPASVVYFDTKTALVFLVFCLIYTPCMATFSMQKNIGGTKLALTSMAIQFLTAYVVCMLLQTILTLLSYWQAIIILIALAVVVLTIIYFKRRKKKCNGNCANCSQCIFN